MKNIAFTLFFLTLVSCKNQAKSISVVENTIVLNSLELNMEINKSLLKSIESSPFASSKSMTKEIELQLLFRKKYIDIINKIKKSYPKRPLIILESYEFICTGCPANYVAFFNNKILITYRLENFQNKHIDQIKYIEKEKLTDFNNSMFDDLKIIYKNLDLTTNWNSNPTVYGTDYDCFDGSNSFYSVYFPDGTIESMYMRCWTSKMKKQN